MMAVGRPGALTSTLPSAAGRLGATASAASAAARRPPAPVLEARRRAGVSTGAPTATPPARERLPGRAHRPRQMERALVGDPVASQVNSDGDPMTWLTPQKVTGSSCPQTACKQAAF